MATIKREEYVEEFRNRIFIPVRMEQSPFIFSDRLKFRIQRHLAFWFTWWLAQGFLYSFIAVNSAMEYTLRLSASLLESLIYLIAHIFLSYSLMYFVVPRYLLKQRYWLTAAWVIFLFLVTGLLSAVLSVTLVEYVRTSVMGDNYVGPRRGAGLNIYLALMAGLRGAITIGGVAAAIKLMKYWYMKEQRNLQLQKENVQGQLQLLKAQIHPHFLFNTLNNIYSYTQNTSPVASRLVSGLSDMLRFILYECNQDLVPLNKELKMIQDYIGLEQIRYGNQLDLHLDLPEKTKDLYIAPLLLLPLIENCFKHGTSHMLEQPWISLHIGLQDRKMQMKLLNGKVDTEGDAENNGGIGIQNVRKRLDLIYPGKYEMEITNDEDVFIVNLKLELEKKTEIFNVPVIIEEFNHA